MTMRYTGERILPDIPELRATYVQSRAVYEFAAQRVTGKVVLDCGAGEGYGPDLLADKASLVVGLDYDWNAVRYAREKYGRPGKLDFLQAEAGDLPLSTHSVDVLCCFQVLEHLPDATSFLFESRRVLRPGGELILTTPNRLASGAGPNPHHVLEYSADELRELLEAVFADVHQYGVFGSERVMRYRARNRKLVQRLLWLDFLGLRYRLPERIREPIHASLTRLTRRATGRSNPDDISQFTTADYPVRDDDLDRCIDLLAVASDSVDEEQDD